MRKRPTTEEFIERASAVHENKYDYLDIVYTTAKTKIDVRCLIHGQFKVTPDNHISKKSGCPQCRKFFLSEKFRDTGSKFVQKSIEMHGEKYDYSLVVYGKNAHQKVSIICKKHGEFLQTPNDHLHGYGCPKCSHFISRPEEEFLDALGIPKESRQRYIQPYRVDGIRDKKVFEFLGDYWHGNPRIYSSDDTNASVKKTFGYLYRKTMSKFNDLNKLGYDIYYMWENDWTWWKRNKSNPIPVQNFSQN